VKIYFYKGIGKAKHFIYGSKYNSIIATSKYYGSIGKIKAALVVKKAHNSWPEIDAPKLKALKDKHADRERCFIICNGPSLNELDLQKIKHEITIGVNALYLNFERMGFKPTYYIVEDNFVAEDRKDDINQIKGTTKLYALRLAYCLKREEDTIFLNHSPDMDPWPLQRKMFGTNMKFSEDASIATFGGNTVTYTSLQIAYHLGLREIYIIGADHDYKVPERYSGKNADANFEIDPMEDDVNHFDPSYFGKGYRWHNPKVHKIEKAYQNAKKIFEGRGGKIFNATPGGKLEVFDRVNYEDIFVTGYINQKYKSIRSQYEKKTNAIPFKYDGKYLVFDGKNHIEDIFNVKDTVEYEIDILLLSQTEKDFYKYTDNSPPMPLMIHPLKIFQMSDRLIRILLSENFDIHFDYFSSHSWHKINIAADKQKNRTTLRINDHLIEERDLFVPLEGRYILGKGVRKRYWKGQIGHVSIRGRSEGGGLTEILQISP
jgi:hypothetical protein